MANTKVGKKEAKKVPLAEFVRRFGTQSRAAEIIFVQEPTLNRWLNGHLNPEGLSLRRLHELGVDILKLGATAGEVSAIERSLALDKEIVVR